MVSERGTWWLYVSLVLAAACSDPDWDEPPTNAAAMCVYTQNFGTMRKSVLYFDEQDRVVRVDGFGVYDDGDLYRATYSFEYDDQNRLAGGAKPEGALHYSYGDQQILALYGRNEF